MDGSGKRPALLRVAPHQGSDHASSTLKYIDATPSHIAPHKGTICWQASPSAFFSWELSPTKLDLDSLFESPSQSCVNACTIYWAAYFLSVSRDVGLDKIGHVLGHSVLQHNMALSSTYLRLYMAFDSSDCLCHLLRNYLLNCYVSGRHR